MRVLAAMSGGVDSAVAAARAVDAGHDVTGVHLALAQNPATLRHGARGCCTIEDSNDARRAADVLGIPFYVWDLAERFRADVIDDFVAEYAAGHTPEPVPALQREDQVHAVLDRALALGFDAVVTGHHARLDDGVLRRSVDAGQGPVVRARGAHARPARARDVPARRHDQERGARRGRPPRARRRRQARLARHLLHRRRRHPRLPAAPPRRRATARSSTPRPVRCSAPTAARSGSPSGSGAGCTSTGRARTASRATCCRSSPTTNRVTVGRGELLDVDEIAADRAGVDGRGARRRPFDCEVQLRAHGMVSAGAGRARRPTASSPRLGAPQRGVAAGQALVMYDGDRVLGSATITRRIPAAQSHRRHDRTGGEAMGTAGSPGRPPGSARCPAPTRRGRPARVRRAARPAAPARAARTAAPAPDLIGRGGALLVDLPVEIVPSGWRLAAHDGRDVRRARDLLAWDLDALEAAADGYAGPLKLQAAGPWTLAASLELPSGHKVVSDHGATRDLAESLAEGLRRAPRRRAAPRAGRPARAAARRAVAARGARRPGAHPVRLRHRALGRGIGGRADAARRAVGRRRRRTGRALLRRRRPDRPAARRRRRRDRPRRSRCCATSAYDALGEAVDAGLSLWLGVLPGTDAAGLARPDARSAVHVAVVGARASARRGGRERRADAGLRAWPAPAPTTCAGALAAARRRRGTARRRRLRQVPGRPARTRRATHGAARRARASAVDRHPRVAVRA